MRQLVSGLTLLVTMCLLAPVSDARAPKPPNFTWASVQFRDGVADRIKSDGRPYVDGGQRGLEVRMWINGSQDLTIGTFSSGRTLNFDFTNKVPGSGSGPTGLMSDNAFVNVRDIAAMAIGERRTTKASFNTAIGFFRWLGSPVPVGGPELGGPDNSEAVVVERTTAQTWEVFTPVPSDALIAPGYTAGDRNVLLKDSKNTLTKLGNYHMAFGLTVTCTTCS
jgi:hypothetical protein